MSNEEIIQKTADYVRAKLEGEGSGHDWWHVYRVWKLSQQIAEAENANMLVVELAALLHDMSDWKENDGNSVVGANYARDFLLSIGTSEDITKHVSEIILNISFKGVSDTVSKMETLEGKIVQDADRLDAIGAIGIARSFTYGGSKSTPMHVPNLRHDVNEFGKRISQTTVNHFYEKLLLLKGFMNTKTGKKIAEHRHKYMEAFLEEFYAEWEGKI